MCVYLRPREAEREYERFLRSRLSERLRLRLLRSRGLLERERLAGERERERERERRGDGEGLSDMIASPLCFLFVYRHAHASRNQ